MKKFTTIKEAVKEIGVAYLGTVNISAKLIKNVKVSNVLTYCMYLAPSDTSGYNVCTGSTKECRLGCLATSGRAKMDINSNRNIIKNCRIKKTELFFDNNEYFMDWLFAEIRMYQNKAKKQGMPFAVRLNGTSDINWNFYYVNGKNVFETFPEIKFYDYTKVFGRFSEKPNNYHLTYSYTGNNTKNCIDLLERGYNVAVVFDTLKHHELPKEYLGYEVVDGDLTDYRPFDPNGVIVGLRFKKIQNKEVEKQILNSKFVVKGRISKILTKEKDC